VCVCARARAYVSLLHLARARAYVSLLHLLALARTHNLSPPPHTSARIHRRTSVRLVQILTASRVYGEFSGKMSRYTGRRAMHTSVIQQHTLLHTLQRRRSSAVIYARQGLSEMAKRGAGGLQRRQGSRCDGQGPVKSHAHARTHALPLSLAHGRVLSLQVNSLSMIESYVDKLAQGTNFSKVSSAVISCKEYPSSPGADVGERALFASQTNSNSV
jgi:hypothetical protein